MVWKLEFKKRENKFTKFKIINKLLQVGVFDERIRKNEK